MEEKDNQKKKKHLTIEEREIISQMKASGKSLTEISKVLGRDKSVISRELKRNSHRIKKTYFAHIADKKASVRKSKASRHKRLRTPEIRKYVVDHIKLGWSPEQISGRIKIDLPGNVISHEAIYQFIYDPQVKMNIGNLVHYLRRHYIKRRKKGSSRKSKQVHIHNRVPIELRPPEVNERKELGHWEGDSMFSRDSLAALNTLVERKSGFTLITKLDRKTAENTKDVVIRRLGRLPDYLRKTLTLDNGSENAGHEKITTAIGTTCYFANPYHSWERGTNENTNGLIRQYFPKGVNFANVSEEDIIKVEWLLNTRPRKRHDYRTPMEIFTKAS